MLDRAYVEHILFDGGYSEKLASAVTQALQEWRELVIKNPKMLGGAIGRERATTVNRRVVEVLVEMLETDSNVVIHEGKQNTYFIIGNEIVIRCKKLTREMRAMNIKTARVRKHFYKQQPVHNEFARYVNITFGWHLDELGNVQRLAVVNEYQDKAHWLIDIDETGAKQAVYEAVQFPSFENDEAFGFDISAKDTERARRIAEEDAASDENENTN